MEEIFEIKRSDKTNAVGLSRWFVMGLKNEAGFHPDMAGDAGMRACLTWLATKGCRPVGINYPECNVFGR